MDNNEETTKVRLETDFFAEKRLLRALYNNPEYLEDNRVEESLFSSSSTKNIYRAIQNLKKRNIKISRDAILQEYSILDLNANENIVDIIADDSVKNEDLTDIICQLNDFKNRRATVKNLKDAIKVIEGTARVTPEEYEKIDENVSNALSKINPNSLNESHDIQEAMTTDKWFDNYLPEFKKRQNGKTYWFRNYLLDSLIEDGPQPGEIGLIAAASGSGKSTVCLNAVDRFIETHVPCAYYSLEMSGIATMDRLLSKRLHIPYKKIKDPGEDYEDILQAIEEEKKLLENNPLFRFCESGNVSLKKLEKDIIKFQKESGVKYWVIVIDLLSMIQDFIKMHNGANFAQGIEIAINMLSALAKKLGVHIMGVLQLKRDSESQATIHSVDDLDKLRPNRAQIKNAGAFLERARYVLTTFRKYQYAKLYLKKEEYEGILDDIIEVSIVKLNNGDVGDTVEGIFDAEYFDIIPIETVKNDADIQDEMFQQ